MKSTIIYFACALIGASPAGAASGDRSAQDQAFVNEAARGGKMEIELGQLATKNGSNADVKAFGSQMVKDHSRLNDELGLAAKSRGLTVPTELTPEQKKEYQSLSKLSGKKFDKQYSDLMVKDHSNDLAAFQKAGTMTKDTQLKTAITNAIPVIEHHLQMAKSIVTKLNGQ
jgi:putative membrane protein